MTTTLKQRLATPRPLLAPGVYDALTALVAEQAGFEALYLSGALDYQIGAVDDALRKLERSLAVRPGYLPAIEMLGGAAAKAGKFEMAARHFEAAAQKAPSPEAHYRHGHALFFAGQHEQATTALRRALALNPQYGDALYFLATNGQKGQVVGATEALQRLTILWRGDRVFGERYAAGLQQ